MSSILDRDPELVGANRPIVPSHGPAVIEAIGEFGISGANTSSSVKGLDEANE